MMRAQKSVVRLTLVGTLALVAGMTLVAAQTAPPSDSPRVDPQVVDNDEHGAMWAVIATPPHLTPVGVPPLPDNLQPYHPQQAMQRTSMTPFGELGAGGRVIGGMFGPAQPKTEPDEAVKALEEVRKKLGL